MSKFAWMPELGCGNLAPDLEVQSPDCQFAVAIPLTAFDESEPYDAG